MSLTDPAVFTEVQRLLPRFDQEVNTAVSRAIDICSEIGDEVTPDTLCVSLLETSGLVQSVLNGQDCGRLANELKLRIVRPLGSGFGYVSLTESLLQLLKKLASGEGNDKADISSVQVFEAILRLDSSQAKAPEFFKARGISVSEKGISQDLNMPIDSSKTAREVSSSNSGGLGDFFVDLTQACRNGKFSIVCGRDQELQRVYQLLETRTTKSLVLVGESGVGRFSVVKKLAHQIVENTCPEQFKGAEVHALDLDRLVAGTKYRGELEEKIALVAEAIQRSGKMIILYIRDLHRTSEGSRNVAAVLKPWILDGKLRVIGTTTVAQYSKVIEPDDDLRRCFRRLVIEELDPAETVEVLRNMRSDLGGGDKPVEIEDGAIQAAVEYSVRFITNAFNPSKSITIVDSRCAKARLSGLSKVTRADVLEEIEAITRIPVSELQMEEKDRLLQLPGRIKERLVGQDEAVDLVTGALLRSRAGFADENRPIGSFIFSGSSGVGKTELTELLGEFIFLRDRPFIRLDMSEYMEKHTVSRLIGPPPGYVGYEEGGQLTERVFHEPYSIVLLDEIEKAHPDIFNVFLQVLDEGHLTDGKGRKVSFKNTLIIMTTNLRPNLPRDEKGILQVSEEQAKKAMLDAILGFFRHEFVNRIDEIVCFRDLLMSDMEQIVRIQLKHGIQKRSLRNRQNALEFTDQAIALIAGKDYNPLFGARPIKRSIVRMVENELSQRYLRGEIRDGETIFIGASEGKLTFDKK